MYNFQQLIKDLNSYSAVKLPHFLSVRLQIVEFYSKNIFEKLVYLIGFIIRIYQDAWSPERQNIGHCLYIH